MPEAPMTILDAQRQLAAGTTTALALAEECLARIEDPAGEGKRTFLKFDREQVLTCARASDQQRRSGAAGPLAGIPISVKDLFDVQGDVTTAGSTVLRDRPAAVADAPAIGRLRAAGAIIIGRTNMVEFAYSGVGLNPHYGTPLAPFGRASGHIPGGSSSGAAVSVTDRMALAAIGTDTAGSVRIPAAFCGIVGFKPTRGQIPTEGVFPLAPSFDTVGPMAHTVADCRLLHAVMSRSSVPAETVPPARLRIGVARGLPVSSLDPDVEAAFEQAVRVLQEAGATLDPVYFDWGQGIDIMQEGRITATECFAAHGSLFERSPEYDPLVVRRIASVLDFPRATYEAALLRLEAFRQAASGRLSGFDAIVLPTVPCTPPLLADLEGEEAFFAANARVLRNTMLVNLIDGCAVSLPIGEAKRPPVGLSVVGLKGRDRMLLDTAEAIEGVLRPAR